MQLQSKKRKNTERTAHKVSPISSQPNYKLETFHKAR
uniref:Uncharacterized protein n=1 Tax=Rhizophora mucronata TaxID=61149 RepID=A0A2P2R1G5_RHIMU